MKRFALSFVLLLLCFAVALFGYFKLKNGCSRLTDILEEAGTSIRQSDTKTAKSQLSEADELWQKEKKSFGVFLDHEELQNLETAIPSLNNLLASGNTEAAFEKIQECIAVLNNISSEQKICLENIL